MATRFDEALVKRARDGDDAALDQLAKDVVPVVLRWCIRLGGQTVEPEDVAHDVLVVMVEKLPTLRIEKAFGSWLFQITRKTLATHRRRSTWRSWMPWSTEPASHDDSVHTQVWQSEMSRMLADNLQKLSEAQREAIVLCDIEERTDEEAAEYLGVPVGTLKSRLRLGRKRFRESLRKQGVGIDELNMQEVR